MNTEWLTEAHRRFGDRKDIFEYVETPYSLWANLSSVFKRAYVYPYQEADIRSIYEFADWSCRQARGETSEEDLPTCIAVCFYEHIPQVEAAVKDLPRWFKLSEIMTMKDIFSYHVGVAGFERMLAAYPKSQRSKIKKKKPTRR